MKKVEQVAGMTIRKDTVLRIRLASKFFGITTHELIEIALDCLKIPNIAQPDSTREESLKQIHAHLDVVDNHGKDAALEEYFHRRTANDN